TQNDLLRERADDAEARMLRRDRQIEQLTAQLAKARVRMDELAQDAAEETYWREYAAWQLESVRAARWHRLGTAITGFRKTRLAGLRGALKGQARPKAPQRADIPVKPPLGPADTTLVDVPATMIPDGPITRPELTAAVIADTFTTMALRYEWR